MGGAEAVPGGEGVERVRLRIVEGGRSRKRGAAGWGRTGLGVEEQRLERVRRRAGWGASTSSAQALVFPAERGRPHDFTVALEDYSYVKTSTS